LGCHPQHPSARPGPPPDPSELLEALRAQQQRVPTLDARVRATSWLSGERLRATVTLLAARDGRLRFEAEVSLQGTVAILTTHDGQFASLDLQKSLLQRGPACPGNVATLMKIPLAPEEVGAILMGDVALPAPSSHTESVVSWDDVHGLDQLHTNGASRGSTLVLSFEPNAGHRLRAAEAHDAAGKTLWRTSYEEFESVAPADGRGTLSLPSLVKFAEGTQSFDNGVDVKFKERRGGYALADDAFLLRAPPGVTSELVGCAGTLAP